MDYASRLQKDADEARAGETAAWLELRKTRTELRKELEELANELYQHRRMAEVLTYRYRVLVSAIMSPNASVKALQELASDPDFSSHFGDGG